MRAERTIVTTTPVLAGASDPDIVAVEVVRLLAFSVSPTDLVAAGGGLLGTPANPGCTSGALKHWLRRYAISSERPS